MHAFVALNYNEVMETDSPASTNADSDSNATPVLASDTSVAIRIWRSKAFRWTFVLCSLLAATYLLANRNGRMIDVDRQILSDARMTWNSVNPGNYLVEVSVTTSGKDVYEVTVLNHEPVQVKLNGKSLNRRHAFDTWTVQGMLDTIAIDIEHCERWDEGRAMPGTCDLIIKATFDPESGIPLKYIRMELGRPSNVGVMDWEITRFEPSS